MGFAKPAQLIRLLLRRSDQHPIRAVGAEDLQIFDPRFIQRLKSVGVLTERGELRDDGDTILHVVGNALIAVEPETGDCQRFQGTADIALWDIDLAAICREIRAQTGLTGPGPTKLSPRIWRLGRHARGERSAEVCLVRRMRPDTAQEIIDHVRGAIHSEAFVAIIALSRCDLPAPVTRQLDAMRITTTPIGDHLGDDAAAPFALDLSRLRLPSASVASGAQLTIDRVGRRALFEGLELSIQPRDFGAFVLLAEEAASVGGWIHKDAIAASVRAATGRDGNEEQADKSINRLRDSFRKDQRLKSVPRDGFIETKAKVGYRLTMPPSAIGFMA
jgi:DNA-binding winged helix-turn-helix (wHTH) protein